MGEKNGFVFLKENFILTVFFVGLLWIIYLLSYLPFNFVHLGILPRSLKGLIGIITAPLIHVNLFHVLFNSIPLVALLFISLTYSRNLTYIALIIIAGTSGVTVWLLGQPHHYYFGASGVVMGLAGFLMGMGFFRKEAIAAFVSLMVFISYWGILLSLLIVLPGVSWLGHASGFAAGVLSAYLTRTENREE